MNLLLGEISKFGRKTFRFSKRKEFDEALRQLVEAEGIKKATLWQTRALRELLVTRSLTALGVSIVSPHSDKYQLAECDLGVTGVDAALPETGWLMLRSSPEQPRLALPLPRVHLAIMRPSALRADLGPALAQVEGENYWLLITGPSRTSDIELTVTIGVHEPRTLYVFAWEPSR